MSLLRPPLPSGLRAADTCLERTAGTGGGGSPDVQLGVVERALRPFTPVGRAMMCIWFVAAVALWAWMFLAGYFEDASTFWSLLVTWFVTAIFALPAFGLLFRLLVALGQVDVAELPSGWRGGRRTWARREAIPQGVKDQVWRRDGGRCAICGSNYRLEFDHIQPVAPGGRNTYRNLQLLCEQCNRRKGARW